MLLLSVRVDFFVLAWNALFLGENPDLLIERTELDETHICMSVLDVRDGVKKFTHHRLAFRYYFSGVSCQGQSH